MRQFLRKHLDEVTNQKSKGRNFKKRVRTYSDSQFAEEVNPPLNAPKWTICGYDGPLKRIVASNNEDEDENMNNGHERQQRQRGHERQGHEHRQKKKKRNSQSSSQ